MSKITRVCWSRYALAAAVMAALSVVWLSKVPVGAQPPAQGGLHPRVALMEKDRIAAIEKVRPAVVAIFGATGAGGGSGVLIDDAGYALTNFHVTAGAGNLPRCGLANGILYDAVLVGHDKVGDVALIKLVPKKEGDKFPFVVMADSDKVKPGDWSLAMGNPFLLATDFTPTVTFGLVSGTHRYQYPEGKGLLEYTDCIQIDTSINPGNSGGPLFNMQGELIGINGRGSFDKRGRVNSGVGYAISINQIKNFMGHLRAGLDADHATVGAQVESESEEVPNARMLFKNILDPSDVARRGLDIDDELVAFAGRQMGTVNQYKNALGLYPRGWRVPLTYRRNDEKTEVLVRLMEAQRQEIGKPDGNPPPPPMPMPRPAPVPTKPSTASKFFEAKAGYANHYFNKQERDRLWKTFVEKHGDFASLKGEWVIKATGEADTRPTTMELSIKDDGASKVCEMKILGLEYGLKPLDKDIAPGDLKSPPKSGGFLLAMYHLRQLHAFGQKEFEGDFSHGGHEPLYLPPPKEGKPKWEALRVMCEVLRTSHAGSSAKWYFALDDHVKLGVKKHTLVAVELTIDRDEDPCEVYFSDYKKVDGRLLPGKIQVRYDGKAYADMTNVEYTLKGK